jgi:CheY-like chemotaxis protein
VPPRALHILLIDDEPMVSAVIREMLEAEGHTVEVAASGEAGLEAYDARGPFGLVITDMSLPGINGDEVALEIKRRSLSQPVLLLTGYVTESIEAMARTPNAISLVVSKPVKHAELMKALDHLLPERQKSEG